MYKIPVLNKIITTQEKCIKYNFGARLKTEFLMFSMLEVIKREKKYIRLESFFQRFLRSYDFIKNKILEN